ncbi:MAG: hypothetical protein V4496_04400 [Pseudomonadota bacterium]
MNKIKGVALLQALFFMMFIMAVVSITMMMSNQRAVSSDGKRMAIDAYPVLSNFLSAVVNGKKDADGNVYTNGTQYFADYPLSSVYVDRLKAEGFSDPSKDSNLTITVTSS